MEVFSSCQTPNKKDEEFLKKVLTSAVDCGNISLALNERHSDARVVELVDSLASGASARKGVRVRLPPRAPPEIPVFITNTGIFLAC